MRLKHSLLMTAIAILALILTFMLIDGCGWRYSEENTQPDEEMIMNAAGQLLMIHLYQEHQDWAHAVAAYVSETLLPKLDNPDTETVLRLQEEVVWGLYRILDNISVNDKWRKEIETIIDLSVSFLQPGVEISEHQKDLLRAFGNGILIAYKEEISYRRKNG